MDKDKQYPRIELHKHLMDTNHVPGNGPFLNAMLDEHMKVFVDHLKQKENIFTPTTYPEMNERIKDILRLFNDPPQMYAAQRIEELEQEVERLHHIERNGDWSHERVWVARNSRGDIIRAQDMSPQDAVKQAERIDRVSKGLPAEDIPIDKKRLTPAQSKVFRWLGEFIISNGYSPSIREIAEGVKLKSSSTVQTHLNSLEDKGHIKRMGDKGAPRSIKLL